MENRKVIGERVVVFFGVPPNKLVRSLSLRRPRYSQTKDGRRVKIVPGEGYLGWERPVIVEPVGARIVSSRYVSDSVRGDYWVIEAEVPVR